MLAYFRQYGYYLHAFDSTYVVGERLHQRWSGFVYVLCQVPEMCGHLIAGLWFVMFK